MAYRVTKNMLYHTINCVNDTLGAQREPYSKNKTTGMFEPNPGTVCLDGMAGGYRLERMSAGGGATDFLGSGRGTKRYVYELANAWLDGRNSILGG